MGALFYGFIYGNALNLTSVSFSKALFYRFFNVQNVLCPKNMKKKYLIFSETIFYLP